MTSKTNEIQELIDRFKSSLKEIINNLRNQGLNSLECLNILLRLLVIQKWLDPSQDSSNQSQDVKSSLTEKKQYFIEDKNPSLLIQEITEKIEKENTSIAHILSRSQNFNWERYHERVLKEVINNLSRLEFFSLTYSEKSQLLMEVLLEERLVQEQEITSSLIPPSVTRLMVKLLEPKATWEICDPFCGLGQLLIECIYHQRKQDAQQYSAQMYGQEKVEMVGELAKLYWYLQDFQFTNLAQGDSISSPQFILENTLKKFDGVLSVPPLSQKYWASDITQPDKYNRFIYGVPNPTEGEWGYIQHILGILKESGTAVIVTTHGALYRETDLTIRQNIINSNSIAFQLKINGISDLLTNDPKFGLKAVISLPPNLFYHTRMKTVLLIFQYKNQQDNILFIDLSEAFIKNKPVNELAEETIDWVVETYNNVETIFGNNQTLVTDKKKARFVSLEEIQKHNYNLSFNRYFSQEVTVYNLSQEIQSLHQLEQERLLAEKKMNDCLRQLGIDINA